METELEDDSAARHAAGLIIEAHRQCRVIEALPEAAEPRSLADAYAIQDLVRADLGPTVGWKTGAPSPTAEPIAAPLLAPLYAESPARLAVGDFNMVGLEAELAFRLGEDLPPDDRAGDSQRVLAAVESVHAAIEVVDTRLPEWRSAGALWKLADNQSNGFFVLGSGTGEWRKRDLLTAPVHLRIDGETVIQRNGGNAAGDPLRLLHWLVDHCRRHRGGLKRGDVVTTGTFTGMIFIDEPVHVVAEFPGIGTAEIRFEA